MSLIDPWIAREAYEKMMRDELYQRIGSNEPLKRYVDGLYSSIHWHNIFMSIVMITLLSAFTIFYMAPMIDAAIKGIV